jgi:hypothetical protein
MAINKSTKAPEINPTSEKIDKLLNRINSGDIKIPAFQRAYVWKQNQIIELLDSIINNYPIGSVLLWNSSEILRHTRNIAGFNIPDNSEEYPVNYVLDGQQRISTIYAVFASDYIEDTSSKDYNPNIDLFEIFYDFKTNLFVPKGEIEEVTDSMICLRDFLSASALIRGLRILDPVYHDEAEKLYSKFINYEVPVVTIKNRSKAEVGMIFERINNTGTKLGTLDLMTAWTWTDDFHLQEKTIELFDELEEKGFGKINQNILLQTLSGLIQNDSTTRAIIELEGNTIRDNWEKYCESLKKTIDFLATEMLCKNIDFLPYQQQLGGLIKFFSINGIPTSEDFKALKRWFWRGSFSNRYSSGMTTAKINSDIELVQKIRNHNYEGVEDYKITITEIDLIKTKFSKANSTTRAMLLLMAQFTPKDLVKNIAVDLDKSLSKYNRKEFHHIFPNAHLKERGIEKNEIFSLVNFCFLPSDSNKKISRSSPSDYFFNIIDQTDFNDILESNLFPLDKDIYNKDNYERFLERRAEIIISEVQKRI